MKLKIILGCAFATVLHSYTLGTLGASVGNVPPLALLRSRGLIVSEGEIKLDAIELEQLQQASAAQSPDADKFAKHDHDSQLARHRSHPNFRSSSM